MASGVGMAMLRLEDKGSPRLEGGGMLLGIWPLTELATWDG